MASKRWSCAKDPDLASAVVCGWCGILSESPALILVGRRRLHGLPTAISLERMIKMYVCVYVCMHACMYLFSQRTFSG